MIHTWQRCLFLTLLFATALAAEDQNAGSLTSAGTEPVQLEVDFAKPEGSWNMPSLALGQGGLQGDPMIAAHIKEIRQSFHRSPQQLRGMGATLRGPCPTLPRRRF